METIMAYIQERKDSKGKTKYTAIIRLKGYPTQTATFERKTDAQIWVQKTETEIREGRHFKTIEARKHTLTDVITRYKRDILPRRKSDSQKVAMHLDWWKARIGAFLMTEITPALLAEYRDRLATETNSEGQRKSSATVNRYIASLSVALTNAVEWGWIEENPFKKVKKLTESRGRVRFLSDEERMRLLKECRLSKSPHLYVVVVLALSTGARYGEIMGLTWSEVDLKHNIIRLEETKNGDRRAIPLTGPAQTLLQNRSKVRKINTKYVFPNKAGTKPADINDAWVLALERAKIDNFRFHDLRHTAASYLAMNGATLYEISTILGHKTLQMVKRYAHLTEQHTSAVLERMNHKQFESEQYVTNEAIG